MSSNRAARPAVTANVDALALSASGSIAAELTLRQLHTAHETMRRRGLDTREVRRRVQAIGRLQDTPRGQPMSRHPDAMRALGSSDQS